MPVAAALRALRQAQKSSRGVSLYSRFVNRPLGRLLAALAASAGLRPNEVTVLSGLATFAGIALVALLRPSAAVGVGVACLLILGFALDASDGQLARLTRQSSPVGELLDHMVDCVKMVTLHGAVLISLYRFPPTSHRWVLLIPLGMQLVAVLMFFGANLVTSLLLRSTPASSSDPSDDSATSQARALALLPADYGLQCFAFFVFGSPAVFLPLYGALFAASALICAALLVRWTRQIGARSWPDAASRPEQAVPASGQP
jgi:phosphatidylglycerophosphate synthase